MVPWMIVYGVGLCLFIDLTSAQALGCGTNYTCPSYTVLESVEVSPRHWSRLPLAT